MHTHLLIYDDKCPLCVCYTRAFVKMGFLQPAERIAFTEAGEEWLCRIDFEKAKNEIPLINTGTGKVVYGIDALLEILNRKIPFVKTIGTIKPVKWFLQRLYKFISYNRKVVTATRCGPGTIDCSPEFSYFYRYLFMAFFFLLNTSLLFPVHYAVLRSIPAYGLSITELHISHLLLVSTNIALAASLGRRKATEYLGQINMLATITMLCLLAYSLLTTFIPVPVPVTILVLVMVLLLVAAEYRRRMHYLQLSLTRNPLLALNLLTVCMFVIFLFK